MTESDPTELPAVDTDDEEAIDHPAVVTDEEAAEGQRVYEAVDDTDDESNGLDQ